MCILCVLKEPLSNSSQNWLMCPNPILQASQQESLSWQHKERLMLEVKVDIGSFYCQEELIQVNIMLRRKRLSQPLQFYYIAQGSDRTKFLTFKTQD